MQYSTKKNKLRPGVKTAIAVAVLVVLLAAALAVYLKLAQDEYKLVHADTVAACAAEFDLDPYLVEAVIHVESGGRELAVSSKGALGLMQLMPSTAEWIAEKLGEEYDQATVTEPGRNIRYGCWYLRFLFDRFSETSTVAAAYNAGHNAVRGWLKSAEYSDDGATLHTIPYGETRNYVEKVTRAYDKYKKLYPKAFD